MKRRLGLVAVLALTAASAVSGTTPVLATAGQPFPQIQPPFTEALYGHAPSFFGGVAFAPNGDVWVDNCWFSGSPLIRFSSTSTTFEHGTVVHTSTTVPSNAGCGLTNHPDGHLYSNTGAGLARLDASTGAAIDVVGSPGNALGITVDPQTQDVVSVAADCRFTATCTIDSFDPKTNATAPFAQLASSSAAFVDGITFDAAGKYLFMSTRAPTYKLTILDRSGAIVQAIPLTSEPDGISFHGVAPFFVVTDNTDGTMSRFDFPNNDYTAAPAISTFASGGYRGDLSLVGRDGCIYVSQAGTNFLDGNTSGDNSLVQICPGFTPSPGVGSRLVYVALGDSYSSGEGAPPFEDGGNYAPAVTQENTYTFGPGATGCHRSLTNYAKLSAPLLDAASTTTLVDRTCSGAEIVPPSNSSKGPIVPTAQTAGRTDTQVDQAIQRLATDFGGLQAAQVNAVTVSMGGNDAGFGDLIQACLIPNMLQSLFRQYANTPGEIEFIASRLNCQFFDDQLFHTSDKIQGLQDLETSAQASLVSSFPKARVLQLTYPDIVPPPSFFPGDSCGGLLIQDANYARSKAQAIDLAITTAGAITSTASPQFQIVDIQQAFGLNPLCPADPSKALANGLDQAALNQVIAGLLAPGTPSRALVDALTAAYVNLRNCVLSNWPFSIVVCQGPYNDVQTALNNLKAYFTAQRINALVGDLAAGATAQERFDNSRLLFHPNAVGWGVMSCNLTAAYKHTDPGTCRPNLGGVLSYLFNGASLSTTKPQLLTPGAPVPFQFNGYDPTTQVKVTGYSDRVDLGTFTADASGVVTGTLTLPSTLNPGVHRIEFTGTNHSSPRTVQVLVQLPGRPRGGEDYGAYFDGFSTDSTVSISLGGFPWGSFQPDASGGLFVEVPLPAPTVPGTIDLVATGSSGRVQTQTVRAAPRAAALWATGGGPDAINIVGSDHRISGFAHSDGGVVVRGSDNQMLAGLEYATTLDTKGGNPITPSPVQVAPGGEPPVVNLADWRPGGAIARQLGAGYTAVPASACSGGVWAPAPSDLKTAVIYVPCGVSITFGGSVASAIVAEGPIGISSGGFQLTAPVQGVSLVSAASTADAIAVSGSEFQAKGAVWTAGGFTLAGASADLQCGVYASTLTIGGASSRFGVCSSP